MNPVEFLIFGAALDIVQTRFVLPQEVRCAAWSIVDRLSKQATYDDLVRRVRELPPMTEQERKEQRASFAYGNLALMREYRDASPEKLEALRQMCRSAAGLS